MSAGIGIAVIWIVCGVLAYHHERVDLKPEGMIVVALIATFLVAAGM